MGALAAGIAAGVSLVAGGSATRLAGVIYRLQRAGDDAPAAPDGGPTTVFVKAAATHQTWDGVGANVHSSFIGNRDTLGDDARARAADLLFRTIGVRVGKLDGQLLESPGSYDQRRNDNEDPFVLSWQGVQTAALDHVRSGVLDLPEARVFDTFQIGQMINTRWASPWLAQLRGRDYERYLDEAAEQLAAVCQYWRGLDRPLPALWQLFNEPRSGNREVAGGSTRDLVDLVKRSGERLEREGCASVRFVVASEETEEMSYESAAAILEDPGARRYVGAIGYHTYPYGSVYSRISRILATAGVGRPDSGRVEQRRRLRELARRYGVRTWMTEVSHGGVDARSYEGFRGRAIHIHDEIEFADASAYFGMNTIWDLTTHEDHFHTRNRFYESEGDLLLYDNERDQMIVTGLGYAMGHYGRWIPRGAVRIDATPGDPLLLVSAFRVDATQQLVLVLINNAGTMRPATVSVEGLDVDGVVTGEQSTSARYWAPLTPSPVAGPSRFQVILPALSVTTVVVPARPAARR